MKVKKTDHGLLFELGACSISLEASLLKTKRGRGKQHWLSTEDTTQCPGDSPNILLSKADIAKLGRELVKYADTL